MSNQIDKTPQRQQHLPRFYTEQALHNQTSIDLDKRISHHLNKVLRAEKGQKIELFNGDGNCYPATLTSTSASKATADIADSYLSAAESNLKIVLYQAISRGDKMDNTVRQTVELGVSEIIPVYSRFAIKKLDEKRAEKKREHWQAIAISAAEQSRRCIAPNVATPLDFDAAIDHCLSLDNHKSYVLAPDASTALSKSSNSSNIAIFIGPETGFDDSEIEHAIKRGIEAATLGPRTLRTETAGPAAVAILQACFGDI